jgi:uncharacterized protein (DUF433 family)
MSNPGIDADPAVCGGEPCIARTRIPAWLLVQARRLGTSEAEILRAHPTLRAEDLVSAWADPVEEEAQPVVAARASRLCASK